MTAPGAGREVLLLANGHGEDVIAAAVAEALRARDPELRLRAYPLVDDGTPFARLGIQRLGPCRTLPSGGFLLHSWPNLVADLRAGFLGMTVRQVADLARLRADAVLVVGDVYAQLLATLVRAPLRAVVQPLVSASLMGGGVPSPNRYFMERISAPERVLLRRAAAVYARDEATARWLRQRGVPQAVALGNPMVDRALGRPIPGVGERFPVALLPGTRAHTPAALRVMALALARVPRAHGLLAWGGEAPPPVPPPWRTEADPPTIPGLRAAWSAGTSRLWWLEGRFPDVLASAACAFGTAGTANEQAAAMGVPVIAFAVPPHYTSAYLANQRRLLGEALEVVAADPDALAAALVAMRDRREERARRGAEGRARMGPAGGSGRIAADLLARLAAAARDARTP